MAKIIYLLALCITAVVALPSQQRIVGGSTVNISNYPFLVALLFAPDGVSYRQICGASIINNRSVLTAAHCLSHRFNQYRVRAGSSTASSGGAVHNANRIIIHPNYNQFTINNDIAVLRLSTQFSFGSNVRVGSIAGANYNTGDNQSVWVAGWGFTSFNGRPSENLRHVQLWTVNQNTCQNVYGTSQITQNMLCAGSRAAGNGVCTQDSGGPLLHNNVIVGIVSFGGNCGQPQYPGVFARVSRYTSWIRSNA
ncbi:trypsin, alkaline B-like [Vanessa atalanta]|uniref:trypsin, alkaline B-like n=1 Tax=Vanessa atalanta TaxID=42275 RepID=UPI001FCDEB93|nr:trypsin, alkaline B-like [Vanessa atalanta]